MIIDCHCHAGKGDGLTGPWDTDAPLGDYLRRAADAGIARTRGVSSVPLQLRRKPTPSWPGSSPRCPDDSGDSRWCNPALDRGRVGEMVRTAVERYGFRGIKVHRHDAPITREVCEAARPMRVPLLYDITRRRAAVELLAGEYPDVNFIIPHLG